MRSLDELLNVRGNNYNLIRLVAAFAVLFSHSFAVVTGHASSEPLRTSLGVTWGSIAVDVFFVISGVLVSQSMRRSDSAIEFVSARALRIWPGYFVSVVTTASIAGLVFHDTATIRSVAAYIKNHAIVPATGWHLNGVFEQNPFGAVFNISLWTLPIEIAMYGVVFGIWAASWCTARHRRRTFDAAVVVSAIAFGALHLRTFADASIEASAQRLPFMFFIGAAALVLAPRIRISWTGFALVSAVMALSLASPAAFFLAYSLGLWYIVLALAHLVDGPIRRFNATGDISYGVYVYAWPVQQTLVALFPGIGVPTHVVASAAVVSVFSLASWHWVEKPALTLKKPLAAWATTGWSRPGRRGLQTQAPVIRPTPIAVASRY